MGQDFSYEATATVLAPNPPPDAMARLLASRGMTRTSRSTAGAIAAAAFVWVSSLEPAWAQARTATTTLSCSAAAALVTERGAIVLSTGPTTYDRFVAGGGACDRNQTTEPAYERTADAQQCFIGYRCRGRTGGGGNGGN